MKRLFLFLCVILFITFWGLQIPTNQKFYYAYDEKIPLVEVDTKLVIRYDQEINKETASAFLTRSYSNITQQWQDHRTVIVSTKSKRLEII